MRYQFVDCSYELTNPAAGRQLYLSGHIPGASFMDLDTELSDLSVRDAGRHPLPSAGAFAEAAGRAGIGEGVFVVAYAQAGAGGPERLWWLLRHFGHDGSAVLRGGLEAWRGPLEPGPGPLTVATRFAPKPRANDTVDAEELAARLGEPRLTIVDARMPERYRGEIEPYAPVAGRIPGAVSWHYADAEAIPTELLDADEIVVYCGSGVSACVDLHALALAGRPDAKLYPGSWSDWSARGLPFETG